MIRLTALLFCAALAVQAQPALTSLSSESGSPGAFITGKLTNAPRFSSAPYLLVAFEDGPVTLAPADLSPDGTVQFLVPYFIDARAPEGYRTGRCSLAVRQGTSLVRLARFEVLPLQPTDNALGKMADLVRMLNRYVLARLEAQQGVTGYAEIAETARTLNQAHTDQLLAMIRRVDESGAARLPLDLLNPSDADSVPVSRRDLEHLAAILFQRLSPQPVTAAVAGKPRAAAPDHCIADALGQPWKDCLDLFTSADSLAEGLATLGLEGLGSLSNLTHALQRVITHVDIAGSTVFGPQTGPQPCALVPNAITPALIASQLLNAMQHAGLLCKLHPVKPVRFTAVPTPNPIPVGQMDAVGNRGTEIRMRTEPYWTPEFAVDYFLKRTYDGLVAGALAEDANCSQQLQSAYSTLARRMFDSSRNLLLEPMRRIQQQVPSFRETPVYKCDLRDLRTLSPGELNRRNDHDDDNNARWGLEGQRAGTYRVEMLPKHDNFPGFPLGNGFRSSIFLGFEDCNEPPRPVTWFQAEIQKLSPCVSVAVQGGETDVQITDAYVFNYRDDTGPKRPVTYSPPRSISDTLPLEESSNQAKSMAVIQKINDSKWQIEQTVEGAPATVELTNTWNRLDLLLIHRPGPKPIRVKVSSNVSGTCQGLDATLGPVSNRQAGNNGCSAEWTMDAMSPSGQNATTFLQIRVVVLGGRGPGFGPGKGRVLTEIEFLN